MALDELLAELQRIQEKIKCFGKELEKSEALTRYALVDPVLRALGWDVSNPEQVRPEFPTEQGIPDYALFWEGKPFIMVEVKALHANLNPAKDKGFAYCWKNKVPYFVITDGERWEVYNMEKMGGEEVAVANLGENLGQAARELLALWRPALPVVRPSLRLLLESPEETIQTSKISIAELLAKMKSGEIPRGSKPPAMLHFPDGKTRTVKHWRELTTLVVEWLVANKRLKAPILSKTGKIIIATTGEGMRAPKRVGDYYHRSTSLKL